MSPQQTIYNALYDISSNHVKTYEALPNDDAPYPFSVMGETQQTPDHYNKSVLLGAVFIDVHLFATQYQRGTLSELMNNIELEARGTLPSGFFVRRVNQRILKDNSTNQTLYHGVLEFEINLK